MTFVPYPLLMDPYFSTRPWGGTQLKDVLGKAVPAAGAPFGEAWELSDHPDGRSRVANGACAGVLFGDLVRREPQAMLGLAEAPERYPLLIKYIDSADDLSVQVHPSNANAPAGDRGKTECWYIMHAKPGAVMIWGLRPGVDAALLRAAAEAGGRAVGQCIQRVPVATGDFIYIPAGTVHATMAGILLCEVQQASNTTYRIYDWDRQPARPLHIGEACAVTNFDAAAQRPLVTKTGALAPGAWHELVRNEFFVVRSLLLAPGQAAPAGPRNEHGLILLVPEGGGVLEAGGTRVELKHGQTWFLPAALAEWRVSAAAGGPLRLVLSEALELA